MTRATVALLALLAGTGAHAEARELMSLSTDGAHRHRVYAAFGVDPTFASTVGYGIDLPVAALGRTLELTADVSLPWFLLDGHHYQLDAGARATLLRWRDARVAGRLRALLTGGKNWVHEATSLGFEASLLAGYVRPRWFAAAEAGLAHHALTYLEHSDAYRAAQFGDVVDGWYRDTGGRLVLAVQGGCAVSAGWELALRVGIAWTEALGPPQGQPYVADLAVAKRF